MSAAETPAPAEPKKGKPIVLIVVALNLLLGAAAAAFVFLRGGSHETEEAVPAGEGHDAAAKAAKAGAPIRQFPPIIVNLNESEGTRYLKATIAIQLVNEKMATEAENLEPVIKDAFISDLSELNFRQTMGAKNKKIIKRRLLKRFNEAIGSEAGVEVLLTEFVVQ